MTWTFSSFLLLALALGAGFLWYERSRPPAKLVALVAALAALAAIGRIAFAPIPNVKPTTDIVLIAGFALGAAPGFTVGAVAALASNVIFGQGPWTPWQMAAWGLCGLFGALLGRMSGRSMGRLPLALACGAAGLGFSLLMDFSTWATYTGAHTVGEYLAIVSLSLPFTIAHVVGNIAFCAAFGPAFLRALLRYRERFTVRWEPLAAAAAVLLALVVAGAAPPAVDEAHAAASPASPAPVARTAGRSVSADALLYLRRAQNPDGGFGAARGRSSTPLYSAWATMALAAAGVKPWTARKGGSTAAFRVAQDARRVTSVGDMERTLLALRASRGSTARLAARLRKAQKADGSFSSLVNLTAFGILALRAAGDTPTSPAIRRAGNWLVRQPTEDGGFSYTGPNGSTTIDDTAAALQALKVSGHGDAPVAARALSYLEARQKPTGAFAGFDESANASSTSWAVQAFVAYGRDPETVKAQAKGSSSPLHWLRTLQATDGGFQNTRTSSQSPVWVTSYVLMALRRRALPIAPPS